MARAKPPTAAPAASPFAHGSPLVRAMCERLTYLSSPKTADAALALLWALSVENDTAKRDTGDRVEALSCLAQELAACARREAKESGRCTELEHDAAGNLRALGEFIAATAAHIDALSPKGEG